MKKLRRCTLFFSLILFAGVGLRPAQEKDERFVSFTTEGRHVKLYWKDDDGKILGSIENLKSFVEGKNQTLKFAMNGGMYLKDQSPQGLFIENGIQVKALDTLSGTGNFYLKPNGVFYLTNDGNARICETGKFSTGNEIAFATQSGPMLLIDGQIHPAFKKGSSNLNIRNGV